MPDQADEPAAPEEGEMPTTRRRWLLLLLATPAGVAAFTAFSYFAAATVLGLLGLA